MGGWVRSFEDVNSVLEEIADLTNLLESAPARMKAEKETAEATAADEARIEAEEARCHKRGMTQETALINAEEEAAEAAAAEGVCIKAEEAAAIAETARIKAEERAAAAADETHLKGKGQERSTATQESARIKVVEEAATAAAEAKQAAATAQDTSILSDVLAEPAAADEASIKVCEEEPRVCLSFEGSAEAARIRSEEEEAASMRSEEQACMSAHLNSASSSGARAAVCPTPDGGSSTWNGVLVRGGYCNKACLTFLYIYWRALRRLCSSRMEWSWCCVKMMCSQWLAIAARHSSKVDIASMLTSDFILGKFKQIYRHIHLTRGLDGGRAAAEEYHLKLESEERAAAATEAAQPLPAREPNTLLPTAPQPSSHTATSPPRHLAIRHFATSPPRPATKLRHPATQPTRLLSPHVNIQIYIYRESDRYSRIYK